ncbi:MAG: UDP-3-O-(3-hydroxymyristoyl)glucosamine N-acyltransferase [Pseudomonadota bacterium]|nr:UDP-3-O-(3-hydroxymyristoyl)glucosamine N-acyltransferase [Pseudomonadota bacterium]
MPPDPTFFPPSGPFRLVDLAEVAGANITRPPLAGRYYMNVASLETAGLSDVSFLDNRSYVSQYKTTGAGCCIVHNDLADDAPLDTEVLTCDAPYLAYAKVAAAFHPEWDKSYVPVLSDDRIHSSAVIGKNSKVGEGTIIGPNAKIGRDCTVGPNVYIGDAVRIADGCSIGPSASIRFSIIGDNAVICAGVRIGEPGFGFALSTIGAVSIPQVGRVLIGAGVHIGANTTIDRGTGPDTSIGDGTRIDNLVQIGHNVRVGRNCIIVAQAGIAGSTIIGDGVQVGGQVGIAGHLKVGDGAKLAAQTGVMRDVERGTTVAGMPGVPIKQFFRQSVALARLGQKRKG